MEDDQPFGRDAILVGAQILCVIPETEVEFRNDLRAYITNMAYRAPELRSVKEVWIDFQKIMHKHAPEPDVEWKKQIIDIYTGKISSTDQAKPIRKGRRQTMAFDP